MVHANHLYFGEFIGFNQCLSQMTKVAPVWLADLQQQLLCQQKTSTLVWMLQHSSTLIVTAVMLNSIGRILDISVKLGFPPKYSLSGMDLKPRFYKFYASLHIVPLTHLWPQALVHQTAKTAREVPEMIHGKMRT